MPELSPILQVAKDILSRKKKEMHVNDIADEAISTNNNMGLGKDAFLKKLQAALANNLKSSKPIFSKPLNKQGAPRRGVYRIKRNAGAFAPQIKPIVSPLVNTLYIGKAGEYAVASELMFWGYNVSFMAIDQGIDLIAEKNGKFNYVQVKTSNVPNSENKPFSFTIQQKVFETCQQLSPWYVFAMRQGAHTDYAVIPANLILHLRSLGIVAGKDISIQITRDERCRVYKLNGQHDINMYINNFGLI